MLGKINIIYGCTASGKTAYGIQLAKKINGEVINSDSMQVYRELPILTAQPTIEEMEQIPHHLYGHQNITSPYSVGKYIEDAVNKINYLRSIGKTPILVGGTGMYLNSLINGIPNIPSIPAVIRDKIRNLGYDKSQLYSYLQSLDAHCQLKKNDTQRVLRALEIILTTGKSLSFWHQQPKITHFQRDDYHIIWLNPTREIIYNKINNRFNSLIKIGAIDEVANLINSINEVVMPKPHGFPEIKNYLYGNISYNEMINQSQQITRNYAKRQITWARHQFEFDQVVS